MRLSIDKFSYLFVKPRIKCLTSFSFIFLHFIIIFFLMFAVEREKK